MSRGRKADEKTADELDLTSQIAIMPKRWNGVHDRETQAERRRVSNFRKIGEREDHVATLEELQAERKEGEDGCKTSRNRLKMLNTQIKQVSKDRKAAPRRTDLQEHLDKLRKDHAVEQAAVEAWEARRAAINEELEKLKNGLHGVRLKGRGKQKQNHSETPTSPTLSPAAPLAESSCPSPQLSPASPPNIPFVGFDDEVTYDSTSLSPSTCNE